MVSLLETIPITAYIQSLFAIVNLGILTQPLEPSQHFAATLVARAEIGVSTDWLAWCRRWKETVVMRPSTRKCGYHALLKVGRWLNSNHPEVISPQQWTRELCAEYVAALSRMKIGEHIGNGVFPAIRQLVGKPLKASTISATLGKLRKFFRDCQEWGWIERSFDPHGPCRRHAQFAVVSPRIRASSPMTSGPA
jgi:hypothetical protein